MGHSLLGTTLARHAADAFASPKNVLIEEGAGYEGETVDTASR